MRRYHSTYKYPDMRMGHMRNIKTNEPIIDFPLQAKDFGSLDCMYSPALNMLSR